MRRIRRWIGAAAVPLLAAAAPLLATPGAAAAPTLPGTGSVLAPSGSDSEVSFESGGTVFHGSARTPDGEIRGAALLLPGSGPTDRNGNQPGLSVSDVLSRTADVLASHGIASLRFDKIGAGATGLGAYTAETLGEYGFVDQVDDADAAARLLADRTGVAVEDLLVLGHSEGGLTALALAERGVGGGFGLLAPLPVRYLDLLRDQVEDVVAAGRVDEAQAEILRRELPRTIDSIRSTATVPEDQDPLLDQFGFNAANAKFLYESDRMDPPDLAATLADDVPVLLTCSDEDLNIGCDRMGSLRTALEHTDLQFEHFTTANHGLEELGPVPGDAAGGADMPLLLPPSAEFTAALHTWAAAVVD